MNAETQRPPKDRGSLWPTVRVAAAAIAGGVLGLLLFWWVGPLAWAIITVGLGAALVGIVALRGRGAPVPVWRQLAYLIGWIAIIAIALYALQEMSR